MKVQRLIELLKTKDPNAEVKTVVTTHDKPDNSRESYEGYNIQGIKVGIGIVFLWATRAFDLEK